MYSDRRTYTQRLSRDISELFSQNFNCSSSSLTVVQTTDNFQLPGCLLICIKIFEGPYRGGSFSFGLNIPETYPFKGVEVFSKHPIWHPNIDLRSGRVALPLEWSPVLTLHSVAMAVQMLMLEPSTDNPLNLEAYSHCISNPRQFDSNVQKSLLGNCNISGVYFNSVLCDTSASQQYFNANSNVNAISTVTPRTSPESIATTGATAHMYNHGGTSGINTISRGVNNILMNSSSNNNNNIPIAAWNSLPSPSRTNNSNTSVLPAKLKRSFEEITLHDDHDHNEEDNREGDGDEYETASMNMSNENSQQDVHYDTPQLSQNMPSNNISTKQHYIHGQYNHTACTNVPLAVNRGGNILSPNTVRRKCMADSNNNNQSYYSDEMNLRISQAYSQLSLQQQQQCTVPRGGESMMSVEGLCLGGSNTSTSTSGGIGGIGGGLNVNSKKYADMNKRMKMM